MVILTMEDGSVQSPFVGQRVEVAGSRGTILYVGPVPPTKGTWLGVDWDDPSRGKHDGIHGGHRYFQARYSTSGSLVRKEKVNLGQTVIDAVKERYGGDEQIMDEREKEEIQRAFKASLFEMVGFERLSCENYESLTVVGLREHRVSSASEPGDLSKMCPLVEYLDLSRNLLNSWETVAHITTGLTRLSILDLSENRLRHEGYDLEKFKDAFRRVKFINLTRMEYNWEEIVTCAVMWPNINKLEASFNNITSLSTLPSHLLQNLVSLNIEGNNIKSWSEVEKLGKLPLLEYLNICNVGLTKITIDENSRVFPSLRYLLLSENYINNWESISELNKLPSLSELRFRLNPVLEGIDRGTARQIVIARLERLKILNTQEIPLDERRGAEYDYLKNNTRTWMETKSEPQSRAAFLQLHPRYLELSKRYGEIEEGEIAVVSTSLKSFLKEVILVNGPLTLTKKLSPDMTVSRVKSLARRLFNITSSDVSFVLVSQKNALVEVPLDNDMKPLSYYSIESGDSIKIIS
ncbi:hypothetical protein GE061_009007 [Apolygus lucorum]|uniref:Tubulin-specific chaperone E n=1 Tax=Apolygus lucorum TaxID=248454 RepID=A0A6A4KE72_APOLU|nr:hypothetical protein GE061_009007 [Apolygus lucorum]